MNKRNMLASCVITLATLFVTVAVNAMQVFNAMGLFMMSKESGETVIKGVTGGFIGGIMVLVLGLVLFIIAIVMACKSRKVPEKKGLAITTLVFQILVFVGMFLLTVFNYNYCILYITEAGAPEMAAVVYLQYLIPCITQVLAYVAAIVLAFCAICRKPKACPCQAEAPVVEAPVVEAPKAE